MATDGSAVVYLGAWRRAPTTWIFLAAPDVKVAHCPTSNSFRGGVAPAVAMLRSGLTVGSGSDNPTLNCYSDIIAEMRRAVLTSRIAGAPDGDLPSTAVRMATTQEWLKCEPC